MPDVPRDLVDALRKKLPAFGGAGNVDELLAFLRGELADVPNRAQRLLSGERADPRDASARRTSELAGSRFGVRPRAQVTDPIEALMIELQNVRGIGGGDRPVARAIASDLRGLFNRAGQYNPDAIDDITLLEHVDRGLRENYANRQARGFDLGRAAGVLGLLTSVQTGIPGGSFVGRKLVPGPRERTRSGRPIPSPTKPSVREAGLTDISSFKPTEDAIGRRASDIRNQLSQATGFVPASTARTVGGTSYPTARTRTPNTTVRNTGSLTPQQRLRLFSHSTRR